MSARDDRAIWPLLVRGEVAHLLDQFLGLDLKDLALVTEDGIDRVGNVGEEFPGPHLGSGFRGPLGDGPGPEGRGSSGVEYRITRRVPKGHHGLADLHGPEGHPPEAKCSL